MIGRFAGAHPLGLFDMALEVASLPATEMVAPVRAALLPGYAQLASDRARLRAGFATTFGIIVMVALPIAVAIGLLADPLVRIALGAQWLAAIPVLKVLAIYGAINVCVANTWPVFIALGRPWVNTALTALGALLLVPLLFWSVRDVGIVGAAWSMVVVAAVLLAGNLSTAACLLALSPRELLSRVWRTLVATAAMSIAIALCQARWTRFDTHADWLALLLLCLAFGALAYVATLWLLWLAAGRNDDPEPEAIRMLRQLLPTGPRGA